ncbi:MAG: SRPBCC family protein [Candidatus Velthaea sp.]
MNASRLGSFFTGLALLGCGGVMLARAMSSDGERDDAAAAASTASAVPYGSGTRVEKVFTINRRPDEVYAVWRDFRRLPEFMTYLQRVDVDGNRSHWVARGPAGAPIAWDAEIIEDRPNECISWRSVDGGLRNAGSVHFTPAPGDRGTEVRVEMEYVPPAGALGAALAKVLPENPAHEVETDLRRFKSLMEAGDIAINGTDVKA